MHQYSFLFALTGLQNISPIKRIIIKIWINHKKYFSMNTSNARKLYWTVLVNEKKTFFVILLTIDVSFLNNL